MIELGKCPICSDQFMTPTGQPLPNHQQIMVQLSNGDQIYIAICRKHEVTDELLEEITKQTLKYLADNAINAEQKAKYEALEYEGKV